MINSFVERLVHKSTSLFCFDLLYDFSMWNKKCLARVVVFVGLFLVVFSSCVGGGGESSEFVLYESEVLGISFEFPADWVQSDLDREVVVATSGEVLANNRFDEAGAVVVFVEPQHVVGDDLAYYIRKDVVQDEMAYLTAIRPDVFEVNGRNAIGVTFSRPQDDIEATIGVTLIQLENESGVIFVQYVYDTAVQKEIQPLIEHLIHTIDTLD